MLRQGIASLAAATLTAIASADACVGIAYDRDGITAPSMARELVDDARGVEIMRVVSRAEVPASDTDPIYVEYYGPVYVYRFETMEVVNGRGGRPLELHGLDPHWLQRRLPGTRSYRWTPLGWLTERGYAAMQETRIPDPVDSGSIVCASPMTFEVGAQYLVFRDVSGALIPHGFARRSRSIFVAQRPVIERVSGQGDPWLEEVRRAAASNRKPARTLWETVFEIVFGGTPKASRY